jgi:signal transduction histidine kinase/ActR/RegA family two-component response regulator
MGSVSGAVRVTARQTWDVAAKRSAGILLHRTSDGATEVLLGHMGGPFWAGRDEGAWSVPKGEYGPEEEPLVATKPFDFIFRAWGVVVQSRGPTAEEMARQHFLVNVGLSAMLGIVLVSGTVYTVRTASRELRLSQLKSDFISNVSHELRTPLTPILSWVRLLSDGRMDDATRQRALASIERNARSQAQLVDDLLDVSRIIAGKVRLDIQQLELPLIIEAAIDSTRPAAEAKQIRVEAMVDRRAGLVAGDPERLQQVLWNLLSNAIKFTPSGGHVRVEMRHSGTRAEISVTDDGAGIRPEFLPHVFDRFHQADRSITRRFGGLGLGLSIVKHLVDVHGGTVRAESPGEGQGSTFTVTLPASVGVPSYDRRSGPHAGEPEGTTLLDTIRVLVVEDERDTLDFLTRLLEAQGATVLSASTAKEGLSIVRAEAPDVLISDIGLPEMDGYDFIQHVRRESVPSHGIPAIALTAYARTEDRMRALRAGFQAHMAKPVEPAELIATVASFVELTGGERRAQ